MRHFRLDLSHRLGFLRTYAGHVAQLVQHSFHGGELRVEVDALLELSRVGAAANALRYAGDREALLAFELRYLARVAKQHIVAAVVLQALLPR